jgi:RHS repeat-associated protein
MSFELNSSNQPIRRYIHENGKDDAQAHVEYSKVDDPQYFSFERKGWYSYIKDQVGTITKVYKHETKQMIDTRTYDIFGNLINQSGSSNGNLGFQSKYYDQESGLNYYYHRYYSPSIGRFINEDPIGLQRGINLFCFGSNDSINHVDQYGLFSELTLPGQKIKSWWDNTYKNGIGGLIPPMTWPDGNFQFTWFEDILKWTIKETFNDILKLNENICCILNCMSEDAVIVTGLTASLIYASLESIILNNTPILYPIYRTLGISVDIYFGRQFYNKLNYCINVKCRN